MDEWNRSRQLKLAKVLSGSCAQKKRVEFQDFLVPTPDGVCSVLQKNKFSVKFYIQKTVEKKIRCFGFVEGI